MPHFEHGDARIHYEEQGSGFPLLVIPSGGINGTVADATTKSPFNTFEEFSDEFRVITLDERNALAGDSTGPLEPDRPWDSYTDDHFGVMDHLGIDKFLVLGFCIGGPFIWNMIKRSPDRIVAAVLSQPVGFRPEMPTLFYDRNMEGWAKPLSEKRDDVTMDQAEHFLARMYRNNPDFVITVDRDFVRNCHKPILVMPDDVPGHPFAVAMESAMLAPNAQVSMYPWKDTPARIPVAVRHVRTFLQANTPS
jgi:pimeloyl-ACP methyl ester carboxylesterase